MLYYSYESRVIRGTRRHCVSPPRTASAFHLRHRYTPCATPTKHTPCAKGGSILELEEVAKTLVDVALDKKANDVVLLDIREMSIIADYFIVCSGNNARQIQAIAAAIEDKMNELAVHSRGHEGSADSGWLLLDFGDIIVHVFGPMEREFYRLERLWSDAPALVYAQ